MSTLTTDLEFELNFTQAVCEIVNTPRALCVSLLVTNKEWDQLLALAMDAKNHVDLGTFADDYLVTSLLRKSVNLPTGIDTAAVALGKFYTAEKTCSESNARILSDEKPVWFRRFQRNVRRLLGPLDTKALERISALMRMGPGACVGVKGEGLVASDKFERPLTLTKELLPFYESIVGETWADYRPRACAKVVKGNNFFCVPKDATTDRGAATEPGLNVYGQLGIGCYLAERLERFGVDLKDQQWNQYLASMAEQWRLATIDLRQASDLLCWALVLEAVPREWFELLCLFRSSYSRVPSLVGNGESYVELEKFCSMGNGYTFALESLLFKAMVMTFVPREDQCLTAVYGDDIIVPQQWAKDLIDGLEYAGFQVNTQKSFLAGSFYESCGTDWLFGQNVRPFFLRKDLDVDLKDVPYTLQVANNLRLWARRRSGGINCDPRFKSLWTRLVSEVPHPWNRCRVPEEFGNTGIIVPESEGIRFTRYPQDGHERAFRKPCGWEGVDVRHVSFRGSLEDRSIVDRRVFGVVLSHLHASADRTGPLGPLETPASYGLEPRRGYLGIPRLAWTNIQSWSSGLEWGASSSREATQ